MELINATTAANRIDKPIATGSGRYLFCFAIDNNGNGKSINKNAAVENDDPVGVKLTA